MYKSTCEMRDRCPKIAGMVPGWPNIAPPWRRWLEDCPTNIAGIVPRWPGMAPRWPRWLQTAPRWLNMSPTWPQHGPKIAPTWHQDGPKWAKMAPEDGYKISLSWSKDGPKIGQMVPGWLQTAHRWPKMAPRWPQHGPTGRQDGPKWAKMVPWPQDDPTHVPRQPRKCPEIKNRFRPTKYRVQRRARRGEQGQDGPKIGKMVHGRLQTAPDGPRWPQDGPTRFQDGPKLAPR
jgi:hypothetical protein